MFSEHGIRERVQEAVRCAELLKLDASTPHIRTYMIACIADRYIHINNIGEILSRALFNPPKLRVETLEHRELHRLINTSLAQAMMNVGLN
ncbi:hypothetical protein ACODM8_12500 [Vibrio ostreicida]|uniref:Uncharacterized protein n=1 Tax=Vibrio ostreicida TaxID=526588 RepID=A0ABT8BZ00_9VIBR|nr:hypothetical protein [Vibrio ostreicida]MDN3612386.1 hypothetical protein [Vibrio ostreicida]NPD09843.1 hypothetical protein [Vibrio ostreicida]